MASVTKRRPRNPRPASVNKTSETKAFCAETHNYNNFMEDSKIEIDTVVGFNSRINVGSTQFNDTFISRNSSLGAYNSKDKEYFGKYGCFKKNTSGKFTLTLDPNTKICKRLFEECPDFIWAGDKLDTVDVGLEHDNDGAYNTFLKYLNSQTTLQNLWVRGLIKDKVFMNYACFENILGLIKCTTSILYLSKIELSSAQLKSILAGGWHLHTFEMMECKVNEVPKDYWLDEKAQYCIKSFKPRGAFNAKGLLYLSKAMKSNKNFITSLIDITVSKDLRKAAEKIFRETSVKIILDLYKK